MPEIGANIGTETIGFSDIVKESGLVHAFEPLLQNYNRLSQVLQFANHKNINLYPLAIADECKTVFFSIPPSNMCGIGHIVDEVNDMKTLVPVECITLDSLLGKIGAPKAIFIDAEGAEYKILCGAHQMLTTYHPYLLLEASPKLLQRAGACLQSLYSKLITMNYVVYKVGRFGLEKISDVDEATPIANWLCLPANKIEKAKNVDRQIFKAGLLPCLPGIMLINLNWLTLCHVMLSPSAPLRINSAKHLYG